jgi:hypothetical protein
VLVALDSGFAPAARFGMTGCAAQNPAALTNCLPVARHNRPEGRCA